ncbi:O-antigen ligase family protein [Sphingomonas tabacisoli]|uniref:O-antigen ligase family protein n=1 Tax=Sphingomonas tabacisoli TaxID=2249466 RepID=A0ABW4HXD4_9SPHN
MLPGYRQEPSPLRKLVTKSLFYVTIVTASLFYGLCVALLPPLFLLYFSFPVLVLVLLTIWALPDGTRGPLGLLTFSFFAFAAVLVIWPDYMAVQIPGFAWISARRIWSWMLALSLLLCLSMSGEMRRELADRMGKTKPFWIMAATYFALHWLTLPISATVAVSFNQSLNQVFVWGLPLIAATFLFDKPKNLRRWEVLILIAVAINCVISILEYRNGRLLWADHIPGFLTVQDEVLQRILQGAIRDGEYRVTSVFTVALCLAEFLSLAVPYALHRAFSSNHLGRILFWVLVDLVLLGAIILTRARLGIVGLLVSHSVFLLLWGAKRWMAKGRDLIGPAISLAYPVAASAFIFAMLFVPAVHNRTIGGGSTGFSDDSRKVQFHMFWPKLFRNPFGYGTARSGDTLDYHLPSGMVTVDSYFISVGLDYGVLGLICFFGMFFYTFALASRTYLTSNSKEAELALPLACGIAVLFFVRLVLSQSDNVPFIFILFGMTIAMYARYAAAPKRQGLGAAAVPARTMPGQLQPAE